jgi:hypothetical protein
MCRRRIFDKFLKDNQAGTIGVHVFDTFFFPEGHRTIGEQTMFGQKFFEVR